MTVKYSSSVLLKYARVVLLALTASATAFAADNCRLKGGDVVPLPAAACTKEGGTVISQALNPVAASAPAAATVHLSSDAKIAAAQQAVVNVMNQTVLNKDAGDMAPEGVVRQVDFDGCTMKVSEVMQLDYGNLFSARLHFKIASTVDFRAIDTKEYGLTGQVESAGGELKAQGLYFLERTQKQGNHITISIFRKRGKEYRPFTLPGPNPYWSTPKLDLWMSDRYGYVPVDDFGHADQSQTRIVYLVNTKDDADSLKKAFDGLAAVCRK